MTDGELWLVLDDTLYFRPCTHPVPWCFVSPDSVCRDALPAHNPPTLKYSHEACARMPVAHPPIRFFN